MARLLPRTTDGPLEVQRVPVGKFKGDGTIAVYIPIDAARLVLSLNDSEAAELGEMLSAATHIG